MAEYRTKSCYKFGHKEFSVGLDDRSGLDASWLVNYFETTVATGTRFKAGETVQVGWMVVLLRESSNGDLQVWEPQFDSFPIKWTPGVNNTLRHLTLQKSVAEMIKSEPTFPSLLQFGLASKSFLSNKGGDLYMNREISNGNDSGWRFSISENAPDDKKPYSLYELSLYNHSIIPFLALTPGSSVLKNQGELFVAGREFTVNSKQNDFLHKLAQAGVLVCMALTILAARQCRDKPPMDIASVAAPITLM